MMEICEAPLDFPGLIMTQDIINTYHNQVYIWVSRWRICQQLDDSAGVDHRLHLGVAAFGPQ
jgi:hypothetical protein